MKGVGFPVRPTSVGRRAQSSTLTEPSQIRAQMSRTKIEHSVAGATPLPADLADGATREPESLRLRRALALCGPQVDGHVRPNLKRDRVGRTATLPDRLQVTRPEPVGVDAMASDDRE